MPLRTAEQPSPSSRQPTKHLFHFLMGNVFPAELAELIPLQSIRIIFFVLDGGIVPLLADRAGQINDLSHLYLPAPLLRRHYARISVTTPEPTVLPPSRTAKRNPWSIAIGLINSAVTLTLSPGITISTPGFNDTTPVTSVVRK